MREYQINRETNTVTRTVLSKGQKFTATAVCNVNHQDGDVFNVEIGKAIVDYRLELLQRKRDLKLTNQFLDLMKELNKNNYSVYGRSGTSKHFMISIQNATTERDKQRENIRFCEERLRNLTSGDYIKAIVTLCADKRITESDATLFIKTYNMYKSK